MLCLRVNIQRAKRQKLLSGEDGWRVRQGALQVSQRASAHHPDSFKFEMAHRRRGGGVPADVQRVEAPDEAPEWLDDIAALLSPIN